MRVLATLWAAALAVGGGASYVAASEPDRPPAPALPRPNPAGHAPAPAARNTDQPVIVLEPSDDPHPLPVRLGTPRLDGTGRIPGQMVPFTLKDQLGRVVTRETLLGRPWIANFIFSSCPTHCPATLHQLYDLQKRIRDTDVRIVTITVDPFTDDVPKLAELARAYGAEPDRWLFLTGDMAEIHRVIVDGFQQAFVANPMQLAHSLNLMHVDAEGRVVGRYKYDFREGEGELNLLRQVLLGKIETPEANRFVPRAAEELLAQATSPATDQRAGEAAGESATLLAAPQVPDWVERLRTTNAMLNALATLLLLVGFGAIKARQTGLHKRTMLLAFAVSIAFLACYLTYHGALQHFTGKGHKPYAGDPDWLGVYRAILWSHIALAAVVPVLAIVTIRRGLREDWPRHRRIAKITFPIWLYVSVTGVVIYFMNAG